MRARRTSRRDVLHFEHGEDVFLHRQLAEDRRLLGQIADAVLPGPHVHGNAGDIFAVGEDVAGIRSDQADNHVEAGGLCRRRSGPAGRPLRPG